MNKQQIEIDYNFIHKGDRYIICW